MDIAKLRAETPGCQEVIHFNNAGASLVTQTTLETQQKYLGEEARYGSYETANRYRGNLEQFYEEAATLLNTTPRHIAYTESATVAWERAFFSIRLQPGDVVVTGESEYASNYIALLQAQERFGIHIQVIPSTSTGEIDLELLEKSLREGVKVVAITHMPTNGGLVNPAEEIGRLTSQYGVIYLLDACQSIGQYPLDVQKLKCDFLSATGRKYLRGPRGTGLLYVSKTALGQFNPLSMDLHAAEWTGPGAYESRADAKKFENWESSQAGKLAFTEALRQCHQLGTEAIWSRVQKLAQALRDNLQNNHKVVCHDVGQKFSGIVTFSAKELMTAQVKELLSQQKINTSIALPSGTLLDATRRDLPEMIRASVHYYNTMEEINIFTDWLQQITTR